jgi:hypothetical protein
MDQHFFSTENQLTEFFHVAMFFWLHPDKFLHHLSRYNAKAIRKTNRVIRLPVRFVTVCHQMNVLCLENCINFFNYRIFRQKPAIRTGANKLAFPTCNLRLPERAYRRPVRTYQALGN